MLTSNPPPPRSRCERCLRPCLHCLCSLIPYLTNTTHVLVIQHPSEQKHALNTGRMLTLGLARADLLITESLAEHPQWLLKLQDPEWRRCAAKAAALHEAEDATATSTTKDGGVFGGDAKPITDAAAVSFQMASTMATPEGMAELAARVQGVEAKLDQVLSLLKALDKKGGPSA